LTIREIKPADLPFLWQFEGEHKWEFGADFISGLVIVDEDDRPVAFMGAWSRAEVHCVVNPRWKTPGLRLQALTDIHRAMEMSVRAKGVGRMVTWIDDAHRFCKRLTQQGWIRANKTSFIKVVR
jgi:hypothetical protein